MIPKRLLILALHQECETQLFSLRDSAYLCDSALKWPLTVEHAEIRRVEIRAPPTQRKQYSQLLLCQAINLLLSQDCV